MQKADRQGHEGEKRLNVAAAVAACVESLRKEALASRAAKRQEGGGGPDKVSESVSPGPGSSQTDPGSRGGE
eukprot:5705739-Alexandrium_andersonii.AAC.1